MLKVFVLYLQFLQVVIKLLIIGISALHSLFQINHCVLWVTYEWRSTEILFLALVERSERGVVGGLLFSIISHVFIGLKITKHQLIQ